MKRWFAAMLPERGAPRRLAFVFFINSMGNGMYAPAGLLFLSRVVGLPVVQVGIVLTVAGLIALGAGIPAGRLADRWGPRGIAATLLLCEGVCMAGLVSLTVLRAYALLFLLVGVSAIAEHGGRAVRGVVIARVGGANRVALRAQFRAFGNVATALGALVSALAIQLDTQAAYITLVLINAATYITAAALMWRLPYYPPLPAPAAARRLAVFRDRGFAAITALNSFMMLEYGVLIVALPIWIVSQTEAPRWMAGGALLINTVLVAALQVRMSRGVTNPASSAVALRRAGSVFLLSTVTIAAASALPSTAALIVLVLAVAVHTMGELWHASAAFELPYSLAPEHAHGEYQGMFELGVGVSMAVAPALLTALCIEGGPLGWLALGIAFAAMGVLAPMVVSWAARGREAHVVAEPTGSA
ncbi:MFS transporter [Microtetraspora sp. AC03309]|uniref:MFS transporter n=1 Tax=Microtetraspora sp. AC03309 TaxID=2779376 RepID=UPI001E28C388|nr:MFS transporter [Microtetraspora sp. AC03309]MCC5576820.1 MFS transporter [Microtetraspora sp. AC03309]